MSKPDLIERGKAKQAVIEGLYRDRIGRCSSLDKARINQAIDSISAVEFPALTAKEKEEVMNALNRLLHREENKKTVASDYRKIQQAIDLIPVKEE